MSKSVILKNCICENLLFPVVHVNIVAFLVLFAYKIVESQAIPSGVHVDGYQEEEVPQYPFQQYIQVRKSYTVEHVPLYHHEPTSSNLDTSASSNHHSGSNDYQTASTSNSDGHQDGGDGNYYHVPRLREEVSDYKKHEVYEEKGYGDSAYDHHRYKEPTNHHQQYNDPDHDSSDRSVAESSSIFNNVHGNGRRKPRAPVRYKSLHTPDGSSTKILEYVASNLHDTAAQEKGIYAARSNIYCPEVIDFDLGSKAMGMGKGTNRRSKPRLQGLGSKILCLKNKYFGSEPLPKAIFLEPSESREAAIQIPSFHNFFQMMRHNVNSLSSFQNSNVPI